MPIAIAVDPTKVLRTEGFIIATFDGKNAALASAIAFTHQPKHAIKHLVSPPSRRGELGFKEVVTNPRDYNISADGIVVTKNRAAAMYSRDCPITFLLDSTKKIGVLLHCGRPAMTPTQGESGRTHTIVTAGLETLKAYGSDVKDISAYITAGICAQCFTHNLETDQELLFPFMAYYPQFVNQKTGGLDLIGMITAQLVEAGVAKTNIHHDEMCTKEHEGLASKRGGDSDSNLVKAYVV